MLCSDCGKAAEECRPDPMEEDMNYMQNQQEIHEAIKAADDALIALRSADRSLSSAGGWGIWDMFGGGFFSAIMKHGKIDQAQREIEEACAALRRFRDELADVGESLAYDMEVGDFLRFADYFFDGFVADWMVQSKIRQNQRQVQDAIRRVEEIRARLWSMLG